MFGWKTLLLMVMPMLEQLGFAKVNEDENETGKDDIIGQAILFGVRIFRAVLSGDTTKLERMIPTTERRSLTADSFRPPEPVA